MNVKCTAKKTTTTDQDFDEDFYEKNYPETKGYFINSGLSKRERLLNHYELYGREQGLCRNEVEFRYDHLVGIMSIVVDDSFDESFYRKQYP
jgi:hypothetical protein